MIKFKKIAVVALSACMTFGVIGSANLGLKQQVIAASTFADAELVNSGDYMKYPRFSDVGNYYKFELSSSAKIELSGGGSNKFLIEIYDSNQNKIDYYDRNKSESGGIKWISNEISAGTYYISIKGTWKDNMEDYSGIKLMIYPVVTNVTEASAEAVSLPADDNNTTISWTQAANGTQKYTYYYKLVVN